MAFAVTTVGCAGNHNALLYQMQEQAVAEAIERSPLVAMARLEDMLERIPLEWDQMDPPPSIATWRFEGLRPYPEEAVPTADDDAASLAEVTAELGLPPLHPEAPPLLLLVSLPGPEAVALAPQEGLIWQLWPVVHIDTVGRLTVAAGNYRDFMAEVFDALGEDELLRLPAQEAWLRLRLGNRNRYAREARLANAQEYWADIEILEPAFIQPEQPEASVADGPPDETVPADDASQATPEPAPEAVPEAVPEAGPDSAGPDSTVPESSATESPPEEPGDD